MTIDRRGGGITVNGDRWGASVAQRVLRLEQRRPVPKDIQFPDEELELPPAWCANDTGTLDGTTSTLDVAVDLADAPDDCLLAVTGAITADLDSGDRLYLRGSLIADGTTIDQNAAIVRLTATAGDQVTMPVSCLIGRCDELVLRVTVLGDQHPTDVRASVTVIAVDGRTDACCVAEG